MSGQLDPKAVDILSRACARKRIKEDECAYLLDFPEDSPEADMSIALADRIMRERCDNTGDIGVQIGVINIISDSLFITALPVVNMSF